MKFIPAITSVLLLFFIMSCTATKKVLPSEERTIWIHSEYDLQGFAHSNGGGTFYKECYKVSNQETITAHPFEDSYNDNKWESFCGDIEGLDYQEGNYYKVKIKKTRNIVEEIAEGTADFSEWQLISLLKTEKDPAYRKKEIVECWIAPEKVEDDCNNPMMPPPCTYMALQYQDGALDKNGGWEILKDFTNFDGYQEGNYYKVKYTRLYFSEIQPIPMDYFSSYEIRDIKILETIKK